MAQRSIAPDKIGELEIQYLPTSQIDGYLETEDCHLLAALSYGSKASAFNQDNILIPVEMEQLGNEQFHEIWTSSTPVQFSKSNDISYATNGSILFGHIDIAESEANSIEVIASDAYKRIVKLLKFAGYPHLLRMWNYFPDINKEVGGVERYKSFCVGRDEGFGKIDNDKYKIFPSASGVGTSGGGLSIHFHASSEPGLHLENPRQVCAYKYPECYGPKSPSFARATYKGWNSSEHIYIAGTASIVGAKTVHESDVSKQLSETMKNIDVLMTQQEVKAKTSFRTVDDLSNFKVYMRDGEDYPQIKEELEAMIGTERPVIYLKGDICRADLLLEIEAIGIK